MDTRRADLIIQTREPDGGGVVITVVDGLIAEVAHRDLDAVVARWSGPSTEVVALDGVAFPAFVDTHNHLMLTAGNELGVPMNDVREIPEIIDRIRDRARSVPAGEWIVTAADWHEAQLVEGRLPTVGELDAATSDHPVLVLRGGHNGTANTAALTQAGIDTDTPDIPGGHILRDAGGTPTGPLQDEALVAVQRLLPAPTPEALLRGIDIVSRRYRAHGIGVVRDPAVSPHEWRILADAREQGLLHVRTRALLISPVSVITAAGGIDAYLDALESQGLRPGAGDDMLSLWGLKLILDGGVEAAALAEPYADRPDYSGTLLADTEVLTGILAACLRRGWPLGAHALGERAIEEFLDVVEAVVGAGVQPPRGQFVIEHGGLITPEQMARVAALGLDITAQQALRDGLVGPFTGALGPARVARMFPWRSLLVAGVAVSAGTDHPIGPLDPLAGIVGMTTRRTRLGVLGADEAIDRETALRLYTSAGAALVGGGVRGELVAGAPADIAVWPRDLATVRDDELDGIRPVATFVAGRP